MKRSAVVITLLFSTAFPAMSHPPAKLSLHGEAGIVEELQTFRKRFADIVASKDPAKLRNVFADSFVHTTPNATREGKAARIAALAAGEPAIETAPATDLKIHVHAGGWVAIAIGTSPIKSPGDGKTYAVAWTITYVRNGEAWQLAASQATRGDEWKN